MKRILLSVLILFFLSQARASDTLTVRQVYNFNVGDTFQYLSNNTNYDLGIYLNQYSTLIITQKTISPTQDSIIYNGNWVITNLDSIAVFQTDTVTNPVPSLIYADTTSITGFNSNQIATTYFEGWDHYTVTQGMGRTYYQDGRIDNPGTNFNTFTQNLIYYSNGTQSWGTPVYPAPVHYQPLPESCAVWNMFSGVPSYVSSDTLYEQIRTGNIINSGGYRWVEMIYRSYDPVTNYFTNDSLIGYFANDSINRLVYYTDVLSGSSQILYDFTLNNGDQGCGSGTIQLSQDTIGGVIRTKWENIGSNCCTGNDYYDHSCIKLTYISGIGGTGGLISVKALNGFPFYASGLMSLCVCGNIIYPDTASGQSCTLLSGINNISPATTVSVMVHPNPATDLLHLSISDASQSNTQLILTDLLGQEVYSSPVTQGETTHDISKLVPGIYTWRVVEDNSIIKTGKVIKE